MSLTAGAAEHHFRTPFEVCVLIHMEEVRLQTKDVAATTLLQVWLSYLLSISRSVHHHQVRIKCWQLLYYQHSKYAISHDFATALVMPQESGPGKGFCICHIDGAMARPCNATLHNLLKQQIYAILHLVCGCGWQTWLKARAVVIMWLRLFKVGFGERRIACAYHLMWNGNYTVAMFPSLARRHSQHHFYIVPIFENLLWIKLSIECQDKNIAPSVPMVFFLLVVLCPLRFAPEPLHLIRSPGTQCEMFLISFPASNSCDRDAPHILSRWNHCLFQVYNEVILIWATNTQLVKSATQSSDASRVWWICHATAFQKPDCCDLRCCYAEATLEMFEQAAINNLWRPTSLVIRSLLTKKS